MFDDYRISVYDSFTMRILEEESLKKAQSPMHPGRVLVDLFLKPRGMTQKSFSLHLGWTFARLNEIINARRGITPDSALAFAESFPETTPEYWLNLQRDWDLWHARQTHTALPPVPEQAKNTLKAGRKSGTGHRSFDG